MRKLAILALSLFGLWDSAYLWWVYTSPSHPLVCLGSGCDVVRASRYAQLWAFPLPAYGVAMYATLTLLIFTEALSPSGVRLWTRRAVVALSGAGFVVSLCLTGIEAFVLHAWCAWCVVSALAITFIFVLALIDTFHPVSSPEPGAALAALRRHFAVLIMALGVGIPAFFVLARHGELPPPNPVSQQTLNERLVRPDSHITGNPQAAVTVVEFGDFECSVCGRAEPVVERIRKKYGNEIRFVFRQFPLASLHLRAETAAEASECAAEQDKFWEAAEKLYERQTDLSEPAIERYGAELGLDQRRFRECLSSRRMAARVERDLEDGRALSVRATPTFFIGQLRIEGPLELKEFAALLNQELARVQRGPQPPPVASPAMAPTTPHPNDSTTPLLLTSSTNAFSQSQSSPLACSEDEAKKYQPTLVRTPEAQNYLKNLSNAQFVDVRPSKDFEAGRIPGAINLPIDEIETRRNVLPKGRTIVLYESGLSPGDVCASSRAAARVLLAHGFPAEHVKVYQDGFAAWEKAGLPVSH